MPKAIRFKAGQSIHIRLKSKKIQASVCALCNKLYVFAVTPSSFTENPLKGNLSCVHQHLFACYFYIQCPSVLKTPVAEIIL
jgi:hypothetical protein